jgi:hypothetical protein
MPQTTTALAAQYPVTVTYNMYCQSARKTLLSKEE